MRRTSNSKLRVLEFFLFAALIYSFSSMMIAQGKIIQVKNENAKLVKEIAKTEESNNSIVAENKKILASIDEKESLYADKMKNVKIAYLTFDDGPSNNTADILKILKDYNVKATFFVNGHEKHRDLYKSIVEDGHVLANHTYSHNYEYIYSSVNNFRSDIKKLDNLINEITGEEPSFILRYPGGSNNSKSAKYGGKGLMIDIIKEMEREGYINFDWNVDSADAAAFRQDKDKIVNSVLNGSMNKKRAIILMHDLDPKVTTVQALPEIIEGLKAQGFIFDIITKNSEVIQFVKIKK